MDKFRLILQLFADGGDGGAAAAGGDPGEMGGAEPPMPTNRRQKKANPLADVRYGVQADEQPATADVGAADSGTQDTEPTFDDLIKGKYKADYDARIQATIKDRFKQNAEDRAKLESMQPMLDALGKKYGLDPSDLEGLTKVITDDDALYEEEAIERGMSIDSLKAIKRMERENEQLRARQEQTEQERQMRIHFDGLARQADALKQIYPGFDLMQEMQNPEFARLTAPGVNVNLRTVYEVIHHGEMQGAEMAFAAQKSAERLSNAVRSGSKRPAENAMKGQQGGNVVKRDPANLTKADRAEIRRRVARGEKIVF